MTATPIHANAAETSLLPPPPFVKGLPLIGNLLDFYRDRIGFLRKAQKEHGNTFAIQLGPRKIAVLLEPDDLEAVFMKNDLTLSVGQAYKFVGTMFSPDYLYMADFEEYQEQRKVLLHAFKSEKLGNYLQAMQRELKDWMQDLGEEGEFDVVPEMSKLALHIAARAFIGEDFRMALNDQFLPLFKDLSDGAELVFPLNWPLPHLIRCKAARVKLGKMVKEVFDAREGKEDAPYDFLQYLSEARYRDDQPVPEEIRINMVLGITWGGYETTTGTMSWALIHLLQNPDFLRKTVKEIDQVLTSGDHKELDTWRSLQHLLMAFWESERLEPVSDVLMRYNVQAYETGGYRIPEGWYTIVSPAITQRLPSLYTHPNAFDPSRYLDNRKEHKRHRFSQLAFGGGLHKCPGMNFAHTEMQVVIGSLLREYELELIDPEPQKQKLAGIQRPGECRVRYRKRPPEKLLADKTPNKAASACPFHSHGS
ncbi:MAG: cytochrome P450 [Saprospirales bacterium]|nr:cytochrome P450 [Saprospirales bacterium]